MRLTLRGKLALGLITLLILSGVVKISGITGFATRKDSEVNYVFYTVKSDDTIWSIACDFTSKNKDIRKTEYEIMQLNDITPDDLIPGMRIAVFKK